MAASTPRAVATSAYGKHGRCLKTVLLVCIYEDPTHATCGQLFSPEEVALLQSTMHHDALCKQPHPCSWPEYVPNCCTSRMRMQSLPQCWRMIYPREGHSDGACILKPPAAWEGVLRGPLSFFIHWRWVAVGEWLPHAIECVRWSVAPSA